MSTTGFLLSFVTSNLQHFEVTDVLAPKTITEAWCSHGKYPQKSTCTYYTRFQGRWFWLMSWYKLRCSCLHTWP